MLDALSSLAASNAQHQVAIEVQRVGGSLGNFGLSLEGIIDFLEGRRASIGPSNARFDVAFLNVPTIRQFIVNNTDGKVTEADLLEIQATLIEYL